MKYVISTILMIATNAAFAGDFSLQDIPNSVVYATKHVVMAAEDVGTATSDGLIAMGAKNLDGEASFEGYLDKDAPEVRIRWTERTDASLSSPVFYIPNWTTGMLPATALQKGYRKLKMDSAGNIFLNRATGELTINGLPVGRADRISDGETFFVFSNKVIVDETKSTIQISNQPASGDWLRILENTK